MEKLEAIFKQDNLKFDFSDKRLDDVSDISSSDDENERDYTYSKSNASCNINDIQAIIYGG